MQPTLFLLIGYPGAGKTTVAKLIQQATGATHLWADHERLQQFGQPTHSQTESLALYDRLNEQADQLLGEAKSVIFDTNFNFAADRQRLQAIADKHCARTIILWLVTPLDIAKQRAVGDNNLRNGYEAVMSSEAFDAIVAKLEPPLETEKVIKIDGTKLDEQALLQQLGI